MLNLYIRRDRGYIDSLLAEGCELTEKQSERLQVIDKVYEQQKYMYENKVHSILTSVMQFAMMPLQGIAQGAQPITSYNYGANNKERVKKTFRLLLVVSLIYSVTLWLAVMLVPQFFVGIFTPEADMIAFASKALRIYMAVMFLFGIQIACQMTFTALGNAKSSIIVAVTRKFILLLPLIYIMPLMVSDKTTGVYLAEPVADFVAVTFTSILFYFQFKKAMKKI